MDRADDIEVERHAGISLDMIAGLSAWLEPALPGRGLRIRARQLEGSLGAHDSNVAICRRSRPESRSLAAPLQLSRGLRPPRSTSGQDRGTWLQPPARRRASAR